MKVWMLWHGGSSYAHGSIEDDVEEFASLKAAKDAFAARADFDPYYPCVSDDASAWIFFHDPNDEGNGPGDPYPDRVLEFGPRGGVRVEHA